MSNIESEEVVIDEHVVLSKFEGEALPENEIERITIHNGEIVSHDKVENGEVVGPVQNSDLVQQNKEVE